MCLKWSAKPPESSKPPRLSRALLLISVQRKWSMCLRTHGRSASLVVGKEHASLHVRGSWTQHGDGERVHWIKQGFVSPPQTIGSVQQWVVGRGGAASNTARIEKRLVSGKLLEGMLQLCCRVAGPLHNVWGTVQSENRAACSKNGVIKVLKGKSISFFLWSFLTCHDTFNTGQTSCSFRHRDIHCVGAGPHDILDSVSVAQWDVRSWKGGPFH